MRAAETQVTNQQVWQLDRGYVFHSWSVQGGWTLS